MITFERVKELCRIKGVPISALEEKVGFGKNSIYSWKKNNPSTDKLVKVADYFDVSTDYLLGRSNDPSIKEVNGDVMIDKIRSRVHQNLSDEHFNEILDFIEFINQKYVN